MIRLSQVPDPNKPILLCIAGNLCDPSVAFERIAPAEGFQKIDLHYLNGSGPWDVDSLGEELAGMLKTMTSKPVVLAGYELSSSLRQNDYRESLKAYHGPVAVIHGQLDTRRKMDSVTMICESLPQARVTLLQTGHTPMWEDAAGYQKALNELLREAGKAK